MLRKHAKNSKATDESIVKVEYIPNEEFIDLLERIGINQKDIGEIFINYRVVDTDAIIPFDESRISIFSEGMYLIDGGQHLKGHGFIKNKNKFKSNYW